MYPKSYEMVKENSALDFPRGLIQPQGAYRFSADSLLLPAFFKNFEGELNLLDLGAGCGVVAFAYLLRNLKARAVGLELQAELVEAAKVNAKKLGLSKRYKAFSHDISKGQEGLADKERGIKTEEQGKETALCPLTKDDFKEKFDLVLANPPYRIYGEGRLPQAKLREKAFFGSEKNLEAFFSFATESLSPGGSFGLVFPAARLHDLLKEAEKALLGLKRLLIVYGRAGKKAELVLLECQKSVKSNLLIEPPLILHGLDGELRQEALDFCPDLLK